MFLKKNRANTGWMKLAAWCGLLVIIFSACSQAAKPSTATQAVANAAAGQVELLPTEAPPTVTQAPTATIPPTATQTEVPTATATQLPTATPVPPLAVLQDGLNVWCAPTRYSGTLPTSAEPPADATKLTLSGKQLQVLIPAAYCAIVVRFNQAAPAGTELYISENGRPFIKTPLQPVDGHPDEAWVAVKHGYVVNPPLWQVSYDLSVVDAQGQEMWKNNVKFYKDIYKKCPFGDIPNPVTLYCAKTDPWEIEPNPGAKYPYDHGALPTYDTSK